MTAESGLMDRIVAEAAGWIVRLDHVDDEGARRAWRQWHDADPRHAEVWRRFGQVRLAVPDGTRGRDQAAAQAVRAAATVQPRRHALKLLAGGIGVGVAGTVAYRQARREGWLAAYRTGTGEQRRVALPQGVSLTLNTGTSVDYALNGSDVDVRLYSGEIMLHARPASAPFRVLTCHGAISATQAQLAVRLVGDATRVALNEGSASLQPRAQAITTLAPGQVRSFTRDQVRTEPEWAGRDFAWTQGMLIADDMRLDAFLAELERYRPGVLGCDADIAHLRVTGTFRVQQTDRVLEALAATHGLQLRYRTRYWVNVGRA